jgi:hypothetical protein
MEYKDPVFELLSSLEHIVFKDDNQAAYLTVSPPHLVNLTSCVKALAED